MPKPPENRRGRQALAIACFFFSGLAGLIYEVIWIRRAALSFGSTTFAVSAVVAVFFGGLALGSLLFGRIGQRHRRPLRLYGWLEIAVAALALVSLLLFDLVDGIYGAAYRALAGQAAFLFAARTGLIALILLPPTVLMGGTLPLFCRQFVTRREHIAADVGWLYGINTLGAVAGTLIAGFWLLPSYGMRAAVVIAAAINVVIGVVALVLRLERSAAPAAESVVIAAATPAAKAATPATAATASAAAGGDGESPARLLDKTIVVGALFFLTGLVALGGEVLWTRFLALLVRNSVHTYTITLAVVLTGIVLGSLLSARLFDRRLPLTLIFGLLQIAAALAVLVVMSLPAVTWRGLGRDLWPFLLLMLPPAILSGALFPLANRIVLKDPALAASRVGRMAALNTLGGIVGSLVVGFAALPLWGLATTLRLISGIGVLGGIAALVLLSDGTGRTGMVARWLRPTLAVAAALAWLMIPGDLARHLPADFLGTGDDLIAYREGQNSTLSVVRGIDSRQLRIDQLWQGRAEKNHQIMAAHLPMLLHPAPHDVLVVGVGVGQTASRFLYYDIERLDCVDIEPALFPFVREHFASDWLRDPRVRLVADDGRDFLRHGKNQYDVISLEIGQVFRPGVESFYTAEFYQRARSRLRPDGLFVQFVPLPFFGLEELRSVVDTFLATFPSSTLWYNTAELLLIGHTSPQLALDPARLALIEADETLYEDLQYHQWGGQQFWLARPENFYGAFLCGPGGLARLAAGAPILHDDRPVLAYTTSKARPTDLYDVLLASLIGRHRQPVVSVFVTDWPDSSAAWSEQLQAANLRDIAASAHLRRAKSMQEFLGDRINRSVMSELREGLRLNPESVPGNRAMAKALLLTGRVQESEAYWRRAVQLDPHDGLAQRGLGLCLFQQNRATAAVEPLRHAVALRPDDPFAHNYLGAALASLGQHQEAAEHFRATLRIDPGDQAARQNLQRVLRDQQRAQP